MRARVLAVPLALLLSGPARGTDRAAAEERPDGGARKSGEERPRPEPNRPRPGPKRRSPDGGAAQPEPELLEHLEEIRQLDLLQNLELFDPKAR